MSTLVTTLIIIAAILLTLLVLVQNSKGGGLASGFASGNQVMGAPKTADFLEKATWTLIAIIVFLSIISVGIVKGKGAKLAEESKTAVQVEAVEETIEAQEGAEDAEAELPATPADAEAELPATPADAEAN
jgi:preprotein translocase subunit SecG